MLSILMLYLIVGAVLSTIFTVCTYKNFELENTFGNLLFLFSIWLVLVFIYPFIVYIILKEDKEKDNLYR